MVLLWSAFSPAGAPERQCSLTHNCVLQYQLNSLKYYFYITIFNWFSMHGAVSCMQTFSEKKSFHLCLFIYWILKFHDTGCRIMQDTVSSQPKKQEFFFIAFVCHHYGIQMMFSKPKVGCKVTLQFWNLRSLCIVHLVCVISGFFFSLWAVTISRHF